MSTPNIILASQSLIRKKLLDQLLLPYQTVNPDIDETPLENESPLALVSRLSKEKAISQRDTFQHHIIIGSDQIAVISGEITGKPHTYERAFKMLQQCSGRTVSFVNGTSVYHSGLDQCLTRTQTYQVHYRAFTDKQIEYYLKKEQPFHSAGSLQYEKLGIALIQKLEGDDPSALQGLPLIALVDMLAHFGVYPIPD